MESFEKLTPERLSLKNQAQLRQVLRREFKYVKGTSVTSKDQLVELILDLKDKELDKVTIDSHIDVTLIYKDIPGREWRVLKVEKGYVFLENVDGFTTKVGVTELPHAFQQMKYTEFKSTPKPIVEESEAELIAQGEAESPSDDIEETAPEETPIPEAKVKKDKPQAAEDSKSDLVRKIVRRQFRANEKLTSGTVMKELESKHGLKIHRSFCSTILRAYKKTLEEADVKK